MSKLFLTSDLHVHHNSIIKFDNRPFRDLAHMSQELIRRWNETVGVDDTTYIVGDISFAGDGELAYDFLSQLNGRKILIRGNHDDELLKNDKIRALFDEVCDFKELQVDGWDVTLCHYPIPTYRKSYRANSIMVYGHVHDTQDEYIVRLAQNLMRRAFEHKTTKTDSGRNNIDPLTDNAFLMANVGIMVEGYDYRPVEFSEMIRLAQERNKAVMSQSVDEIIDQIFEHA